MLKKCVEVFEQESVALAIVACRRTLIDESGKRFDNTSNRDVVTREVAFRDLLMKNCITLSGAMIKAKAFSACGGFDEGLACSEDRDLWIRISREFDIRVIPSKLIEYRVHSSSVSHNAHRMNQDMTMMLKKTHEMGTEEPLSWLFWNSIMAFKDYQVSWMLTAQGEHLRAIGFVLRSLLRYPLLFDCAKLDEPIFFRVRALRTFFVAFISRRTR
jgi:hypothetical protein